MMIDFFRTQFPECLESVMGMVDDEDIDMTKSLNSAAHDLTGSEGIREVSVHMDNSGSILPQLPDEQIGRGDLTQ